MDKIDIQVDIFIKENKLCLSKDEKLLIKMAMITGALWGMEETDSRLKKYKKDN